LRFFLERYEATRRAKLDSIVGCQMGEVVKLPTMDDILQVLKLAETALLSLLQRRNASPVRAGLK